MQHNNLNLKNIFHVLAKVSVVLVLLAVNSAITPIAHKALAVEPLQGGVNMSRELPPVPNELKSGAQFDVANLPTAKTFHNWLWIPPWMAGNWHRETQTNFTPRGPVTITSRSDSRFGDQVDNRGGIWHYYSWPQIKTVEADKYIEWQITTEMQPIQTNMSQVIKRAKFMSIDVNKRNNKIIRVQQKEQIDTVTPSGPGALLQQTYLTIFSEKGKRLGSVNGQAPYYQTQPFIARNVDEETGLNLHQDFIDYLKSQKLIDLIPNN